MKREGPRRKIIPTINKASEALITACFNAKKLETSDNKTAALEFAKEIRDFKKIHLDPLYRISKDIVQQIKSKPKKKISDRQNKALKKVRNLRKINQKL